MSLIVSTGDGPEMIVSTSDGPEMIVSTGDGPAMTPSTGDGPDMTPSTGDAEVTLVAAVTMFWVVTKELSYASLELLSQTDPQLLDLQLWVAH